MIETNAMEAARDAKIGMFVLTGIALGVSILAHALVKRRLLASFLTAIITPFLFVIVDTVHRGHLDKFAGVAFLFGAIWAFLIAAGVGGWFELMARRPRLPRRK